jgi:hypothetical protein
MDEGEREKVRERIKDAGGMKEKTRGMDMVTGIRVL